MIGCVYVLIREKLVEKKQRVTKFEQRESLKLEFSRLRSRLVETDKGAKEIKVTHRGNVKTKLVVSVNLLQLSAHLWQGLFKVLSFFPYFYHKRVKLSIQILALCYNLFCKFPIYLSYYLSLYVTEITLLNISISALFLSLSGAVPI